jgi:hypothetical protein
VSRTTVARTLTLVLYVLVVNAVDAGQLRFTKGTDLSGIGLRLKMMPNARETPLPPPIIFTYLVSDSNGKNKVEMFLPYELWIEDQHAGDWKDKYGNTLTLARIRRPLATVFTSEHVTKEEYAANAGQDPDPDSWNLESLEEWVEAFSKQEAVKGSHVSRPATRFSSLMVFEFEDSDTERIAYAFRLSPSAVGQRKASPNWYLALFSLEPKTALKAAAPEIRRRFLSTITVAKTESPKNGEGPSRKFQSRKNAPGDSVSKEFKESRDRVARSIENMKDWWFVETPHYILLSDLSANYRHTLRDLQENLELLRTVLESFILPQKPMSVVSVIRAFAIGDEYNDYVGTKHAWTSGIWHPARQELVIRSFSEFRGRGGKEAFLGIVYHEAFHQYIYYALDQTHTSAWFNEGHAALFESAEFSNRGVRIRENKSRVHLLNQHVDLAELDLETLMQLSYEDFYGTKSDTRQSNYAIAWGLIYYLIKGVPLESRSPYSELLEQYLTALIETENEELANTEILSRYDINALEQAMTKFWNSPSRRSKADRHRLFKRKTKRM